MARSAPPRAAAARDRSWPKQAAGVSAKMIRHYERVGLLPVAGRTFAGYRLYAERDVHRIRFVKRARTLGFSIPQIQDLLNLWDDRDRSSAEVKRLASAHIAALETQIRALRAMQRSLSGLAERCHGDTRPDCPILDELADAEHADAEHA
jgi:MerR family transcriptional regulator, copper efflux regulator